MSLACTLRVIAIREYAKSMVGPCSDYQIMMCAAAAKQIVSMKADLSDLSDSDLDALYNWMSVDVQHYDTFRRTDTL